MTIPKPGEDATASPTETIFALLVDDDVELGELGP